MELEGAKRAFSFLTLAGVSIAIFVSDRHRGIAKWIRTAQLNTVHFFDIWHVARSITKKVAKLSRESGCEVVKGWVKAIRNHLYWCVTSTKQGYKEMILAKWAYFRRHVSNRHSGHDNNLFKECAHGELKEPRKWIKMGMKYGLWYV